MTSEIFASAALLRSSIVSRGWQNSAVEQAFESGEAATKAAHRGVRPTLSRVASRISSQFDRKWQRSPDRVKSMRRKRTFGGASALPPALRHQYTTGEAAALVVIAEQIRKLGHCALPLDRIAANAGVSRTTVQNALRVAKSQHHVSIEYRPRPGAKNLTNVIRIVSNEWKTWMEGSIGFKELHPTLSPRYQKKKGREERADKAAKWAFEKAKEAREAARAASEPFDAARHQAALDAIRRAQGLEPEKPHYHDGPTLDLRASRLD